MPFDAKKRGPEERAAMLEKLGFSKFVYDYRAGHVPTFDAEMEALQKHHIELLGWWFPGTLNDEAKLILDVIKRPPHDKVRPLGHRQRRADQVTPKNKKHACKQEAGAHQAHRPGGRKSSACASASTITAAGLANRPT